MPVAGIGERWHAPSERALRQRSHRETSRTPGLRRATVTAADTGVATVRRPRSRPHSAGGRANSSVTALLTGAGQRLVGEAGGLR